jgi:hypothetical protein
VPDDVAVAFPPPRHRSRAMRRLEQCDREADIATRRHLTDEVRRRISSTVE